VGIPEREEKRGDIVPSVKYPLRIRVAKESTGATDEYLQTEKVEPERIWCIQTLAFENETSVTAEVRVYIEGHGYPHYILQQENPPAADLYWFTDDFLLVEGERLVCRFTGTTSGDLLRMYLTGYWMFSEKGGYE